MNILADTNILLRLDDATHPRHAAVQNRIRKLESRGDSLVLVPQTLYEYWTVATRSVAANGLGWQPNEVRDALDRHLALMTLLQDSPDLAIVWLDLVTQHGVTGVNAHDARLVAAMATHGITHLLTFNGRDFRRYAGVTVVEPQP